MMARSLCHSPVPGISVAAPDNHREYPCSTTDDDEEEEEDVEFEFRPLLLPQPRGAGRAIVEGPRRTGRRRVAENKVVTRQPARHARSVSAASAKAEQQAAPAGPAPAPRRAVRWHHMAFGSVRVPSAMDMSEIRRRLKARQQQVDGSAHGPSSGAAEAEGWAPWRLIRSLSCKGVEAVAVAAVAAPVRLV